MTNLFITERLKKEGLQVTKEKGKEPNVTTGPPVLDKKPTPQNGVPPVPETQSPLNPEGKLEQLLDDLDDAHSSISEAYTSLASATVRISQVPNTDQKHVKLLQDLKGHLHKAVDDLIALQIHLSK